MGGASAALADPVRLLELVVAIKDAETDRRLTDWFARHHLTMAEVTELVSTVAYGEPEADLETRVPGLRSQSARKVATLLYLRGVDPDVVARILNVPEDHVSRYLSIRSVRGATPLGRAIVAQHFSGATVAQIAADTGLSAVTVYDTLSAAGVTPSRRRREAAGRVQQIVVMRQQGKSYPEIQAATGASQNQVRMALRRAGSKGLIPNYGAARCRSGAHRCTATCRATA
ncbi:MAG: hypothetical protein M3P85_13850 [Actinomycetota bacterium]|nr:hypothetical protein [Actinomycetota bacterium]